MQSCEERVNSELFLRPNLLIMVSQNKTDRSHPEKAGAAQRLRLIFDDIRYTRMSNGDYHCKHPPETASQGAKGMTRGGGGGGEVKQTMQMAIRVHMSCFSLVMLSLHVICLGCFIFIFKRGVYFEVREDLCSVLNMRLP